MYVNICKRRRRGRGAGENLPMPASVVDRLSVR